MKYNTVLNNLVKDLSISKNTIKMYLDRSEFSAYRTFIGGTTKSRLVIKEEHYKDVLSLLQKVFLMRGKNYNKSR